METDCGDDARSRVLIVDDETTSIDVLYELLKPFYRMAAAKDGARALAWLESHPLPDIILLDVSMPGMDGYEVCRRLKECVRTRELPVIFITASTSVEEETRGFEAGAVDYIGKPYSPAIVLARVKTHIELKKRGEMLERLAILDGLTSIPNRRRFDQFLDYEWGRSLRYAHPFALLLLDIDHFKLYNDHYGHTRGDDCLRQVAHAIVRTMPRSVDLAARYGGEEFACILPETDASGALAAANRILEAIRALRIPHNWSKVAEQVTLSIGIVSLVPTAERCTLEMVTLADEALYRAKQEGRDRAICCGTP